MNLKFPDNRPYLLERKGVQIIAALLTLVLGVVGAKLLMSTAPKAEKRPAVKTARLVQDQTIRASNTVTTVTGFGVVEPKQQVTLMPRVSAPITSLGKRFVPGQTVQQGELLVKLDPTDFKLALATAQANLAQAQAALAQEQGNQAVARADFELLEMEVTDREKNLILRSPQLQAAQAQVEAAQSTVHTARFNLDRTEVRAPFSGRIIKRQANLGMQANPSTPLGVLASADAFWVTASVPQRDIQWITFPSSGQKGSPGCVFITTTPRQSDTEACHPGHVLSLQGFVEQNGRQAQVLFEVTPNPKAPSLLISQYVQIQIQGKTLNNVFVLEPSHVHGTSVWLNNAGQLKIQPIEIAFRGQNKIVVQGGLQNGDRLITTKLSAAIDGMAIRTPGDSAPTAQAAPPARQPGG